MDEPNTYHQEELSPDEQDLPIEQEAPDQKHNKRRIIWALVVGLIILAVLAIWVWQKNDSDNSSQQEQSYSESDELEENEQELVEFVSTDFSGELSDLINYDIPENYFSQMCPDKRSLVFEPISDPEHTTFCNSYKSVYVGYISIEEFVYVDQEGQKLNGSCEFLLTRRTTESTCEELEINGLSVARITEEITPSSSGSSNVIYSNATITEYIFSVYDNYVNVVYVDKVDDNSDDMPKNFEDIVGSISAQNITN